MPSTNSVPGGGSWSRVSSMDERGLAGAGWPDDGDASARLGNERHVVRATSVGADGYRIGQVAGLDAARRRRALA